MPIQGQEQQNASTTNLINVPPPQSFDLYAAEAAERWEDWKLEFDAYSDIVQLTTQPKTVQKGTFLRALGIIGHKIYKTFTFEQNEDKDDLNTIIMKFDKRFAPERNESYETYIFRNRVQKSGETFDEWLSDLRIKAQTCNFGDALERNLRDQIIFGILNDVSRQTMLRKKCPSLTDIISIGRKAQATETYKSAFNTENRNVAAIRREPARSYKTSVKQSSQGTNSTFSSSHKTCGNCGRVHERRQCPAYGAKCNNCDKLNHYAKVCRQRFPSNQKQKRKNIHEFTEENTPSLATLCISAIEVHSATTINDPWYHKVTTTQGSFLAKMDTGADCNVISEVAARKLKLRIYKTKPVTLEAYGGEKIIPVGEVSVRHMEDASNQCILKFLVVSKSVTPILGRKSCSDLGLIQRVHNLTSKMTPEKIIEQYEDCFKGVGQFGRPHHIQLEDMVPINRHGRPIPIALHPKVQKELNRMEKEGIIKRVTESTEWCSEMISVLKPDGSIRICIDPVDLKKAIRRPNHPMTSFEALAARMPGAKYFTVVDADAAFWQVAVDEESSFFLTFATPFGLYRYLRLPMGTPDARSISTTCLRVC